MSKNKKGRGRDPVPGKLIAVEGLDGSGKSTQVRLLWHWLRDQHMKVYFSEWNSSPLIKGATKRGKQHRTLTPTTFSLIHAADFADRYERQILPMLKAGYIVLCDRYLYTALARDGARGCDPNWILNLYRDARQPDITFYFRVPREVALDRILRGRPELKWYEAGMDLDLAATPDESFPIFQGIVMEKYETMAPRFDFTVLDGTTPIPRLQIEMRRYVSDALDLDDYRFRGGWPGAVREAEGTDE